VDVIGLSVDVKLNFVGNAADFTVLVNVAFLVIRSIKSLIKRIKIL